MAGDNDNDNDMEYDKMDYAKQLDILKEQNDRRLLAARQELAQEAQQRLEELEEKSNSSPFASFKKFIDSSLSNLTHLPSNVSELRSSMQREQERRQEEQDEASYAWTGSNDSPDQIQMEVARSSRAEKEEAHANTLMLLTEAFRRNQDVPARKIEALYEDRESVMGELDRLVNPMLALGGAWFFTPETGDRIPVGKDKWSWIAPSPRWLSVDWFKRSPYSPIQLELHPLLEDEGSKWRRAFEDLMNASLDKPMDSSERVGERLNGLPQSTHWGPGLDWMLSLQCRGVLPPLLPRYFNDRGGKQMLHTRPHHILSHVQKNIPWSSDHSLNWHSALDRDISDLMSEVAIKATPLYEAEPLEFTAQPETEQDLYDSRFIYPPDPAPTKIPQTPLHQASKAEQWADADVALWEAIDNKNAAAAAQILGRWYQQHGDIMELVNNPLNALSHTWSSDPHSGSFSVLAEAIRRTDIPEHHYLKQRAYGPEFEAMEQADQSERDYRRSLMEYGDYLSGRPVAWPLCSVDELENKIGALEQEHDNILEMTGATKNARAEAALENREAATLKKPDVLSALTTTQTTRLPDGTVTTKVVLKKRFADGREETTESLHTSNENVDQHHLQAADEQPKKKGWFWS